MARRYLASERNYHAIQPPDMATEAYGFVNPVAGMCTRSLVSRAVGPARLPDLERSECAVLAAARACSRRACALDPVLEALSDSDRYLTHRGHECTFQRRFDRYRQTLSNCP